MLILNDWQGEIGVCLFSIAAVTNNPRTGSFKTTQMYDYTVQEIQSLIGFHWGKINMLAEPKSFLEFLGENVSLPFQASRNCLHSLASGPCIPLQSQQCCISLTLFLSHISLTLSFLGGLGGTGSNSVT